MSRQIQIDEALVASLDWATPIYLLVDPILGDFLPQLVFSENDNADAIREKREQAFGRSVYPIPLTSGIQLPAALHPYLVALTSAHDPWIAHSVKEAVSCNRATWEAGIDGNGWSAGKIGGWLQSSLPGEYLADMLAKWMHLKTEIRTQARYLRLADSRTLALLAHVLGEEALTTRMGRIARWSFIDAYGRLASLSNPSSGEASDECSLLPRFDRKQWHFMELGPVIHGAIARAWGETVKRGVAGLVHDASIPYTKAIVAAESYAGTKCCPLGLSCTTLEDRSAAVALSLLYPGWENQEELDKHLDSMDGDQSISAQARRLCDLHERLAAEKHTSEKTS